VAWVLERTTPTKRPRLSAKLVPTFANRACHVVNVTHPYGRNLRNKVIPTSSEVGQINTPKEAEDARTPTDDTMRKISKENLYCQPTGRHDPRIPRKRWSAWHLISVRTNNLNPCRWWWRGLNISCDGPSTTSGGKTSVGATSVFSLPSDSGK
jgi:hypothetical protein